MVEEKQKNEALESKNTPIFFRTRHVSARRTRRRETVTVRGKPQVRHRDLRTGRFLKKP